MAQASGAAVLAEDRAEAPVDPDWAVARVGAAASIAPGVCGTRASPPEEAAVSAEEVEPELADGLAEAAARAVGTTVVELAVLAEAAQGAVLDLAVVVRAPAGLVDQAALDLLAVVKVQVPAVARERLALVVSMELVQVVRVLAAELEPECREAALDSVAVVVLAADLAVVELAVPVEAARGRAVAESEALLAEAVDQPIRGNG